VAPTKFRHDHRKMKVSCKSSSITGWGPGGTRIHDKGDIQQECFGPPQIYLPEYITFCQVVGPGPRHLIDAQLVATKASAGHWSSVTCQVRSGLYLSTFWAILRVSGPKSFSYTTPS